MTITPTLHAQEPRYPGFRPRQKLFELFSWAFTGGLTIPLTMAFLLSCGSLQAQTKDLPAKAPIARESTPPCKGKVAMPPTNQNETEPPPCSGIVAPPPCKGEISIPNPPPEPPERLYRVVSLEDYYTNSRSYVGMRLRMSGRLGRMRSGQVIDQGFYIYMDNPQDWRGNRYGCPLVGNVDNIREGALVTVEGVVIRRSGSPGDGPRGTYYPLQIDQIYVTNRFRDE